MFGEGGGGVLENLRLPRASQLVTTSALMVTMASRTSWVRGSIRPTVTVLLYGGFPGCAPLLWRAQCMLNQ